MDFKTQILKVFPGVQTIRFKFQRFYKKWLVGLRSLPGNSKYFGPPRGIYLQAEDVHKEHIVEKIHFVDQYKVVRNVPITQSSLVQNEFAKFLDPNIFEKNGYKLFNIRYYPGFGGAVITDDDKIFFPCSPLRNEWYPDKHHMLYKIKLPKTKGLDKVLLVDSNCAEDNYGHWMMDLMPRFFWIKKMIQNTEDYILLINKGNHKYHIESLKILSENGIKFKEIIGIDSSSYAIKEAIIPPYSTYALSQNHWSRSYEEVAFVRDLINPVVNNDSPQKIYISRRKSMRTFEGEEVLVKLLERVGYQEVFLEDLSLKEQATMFYNAKTIIGLHGSGFTNLFFTKPQTKVLEIFGANFIIVDFWSIANIQNLEYYAYCQDETYKFDVPYRVARQMPVVVNPERLFEFARVNNFF